MGDIVNERKYEESQLFTVSYISYQFWSNALEPVHESVVVTVDSDVETFTGPMEVFGNIETTTSSE